MPCLHETHNPSQESHIVTVWHTISVPLCSVVNLLPLAVREDREERELTTETQRDHSDCETVPPQNAETYPGTHIVTVWHNISMPLCLCG